MEFKKKKYTRVASVIVILTMIISMASLSSYAKEKKKINKGNKNEISKSLSLIESEIATAKDETVYVIADSEGNPNKIIVSDWLKNPNKVKYLKDKSDLEDIKNVEGNEKYTINKDNMKVWNANGKDIYYQGKTNKKLPVDVSVSYKLDGKPISPQKLAGKKGKVTIRFDYTNNEYKNVNINGKNVRINVPFAVMSGTILDNKNFKNVNVTNGKILNDGNKTFVMGFALPGLKENLNLGDKVEIPEYVEFTADVKDFDLGSTMTMVSNEMFNNIKTNDLKDTDSIKKELDEFVSAANKLTDGSNQLYKGMTTLMNKSKELVEGINKLQEGSVALSKGADLFGDGVSKLNTGLVQLNTGLGTLVQNNDKINMGSEQVFASLLNMAQEQISAKTGKKITLTKDNYKAVLEGIAAEITPEKAKQMAYNEVKANVEAKVKAKFSGKMLEIRSLVQKGAEAKVVQGAKTEVSIKVKEAVEKERPVIEQAVRAKLKGQPEAAIQGAVEKTINDKIVQETQKILPGIVAQKVLSDVVQTSIDQETQRQLNEMITSTTDAIMKGDDTKVSPQVKKEVDVMAMHKAVQQKMKDGIKNSTESLRGLIVGLDSYNQFYNGLHQYTAGVNSAYNGSLELMKGSGVLNQKTGQLTHGAKQLKDGLTLLQSNTNKMTSGINELQKGSMELSDGMKKFNEEGVQKIAKIFEGNLGELSARIKATVDVSKDYTSFSDKAKGTKSNVKFVYKTAEIEKSKKNKK